MVSFWIQQFSLKMTNIEIEKIEREAKLKIGTSKKADCIKKKACKKI